MHDWLHDAADRLAREAGGDRSEYELTDADVDTLLDLARVAAHESGERTNAPLLCYLVGLAHARSGRDLEKLADAAGTDES